MVRTQSAKVDAAEFLSAFGTFLAAFAAFASVGIIIFRHDPHIVWTSLIMAGWVFGISMQIVAGAIARLRAKTCVIACRVRKANGSCECVPDDELS